MKRTLFGVALTLGISSAAFADGELNNDDKQDYEYTVRCSGSENHGTFHQGNNFLSGSFDGCQLKIKGAGSAKLNRHSKCKIKEHMLECD